MKKYTMYILLLVSSCSSADERLEKKRMSNNVTVEKIYRLSDEKYYIQKDLKLRKKQLYPWENSTIFPKISIDNFRCKGNRSNKVRKCNNKVYSDCDGLHDHGLPYIDGKEFVYPILITLLNNLQNSLEKKVIITSAHRCPKHNSYVTLGTSKLTKFMIGAKVDFYVKGLEYETDKVIEEIMELYAKENKPYFDFQKIRQADGSVMWRNKEVLITVHKEGEHSILQDLKNAIISLEVLYDREKKNLLFCSGNRLTEDLYVIKVQV